MYRILSRALIALVVAPTLGALPTPAQAQTMFHACYVPSVGAIYLIQEQGLNQTCLDPAHQEIEWTSGGVESIVDGSITTAKLADGSVTLAKLAPGIHWAQVAANGLSWTGSPGIVDVRKGVTGTYDIDFEPALDIQNCAHVGTTQMNGHVLNLFPTSATVLRAEIFFPAVGDRDSPFSVFVIC